MCHQKKEKELNMSFLGLQTSGIMFVIKGNSMYKVLLKVENFLIPNSFIFLIEID